MRSNLGNKARLQHIYDAILEIESYIKNSSYETFHSKYYDAVCQCKATRNYW